MDESKAAALETGEVRLETSPAIGALALALSKAQGKIRTAAKDKTNPHFKNSYADLASVWDACREPLAANELAVVQTTELSGEKGITVVTRLIHSSGEWIVGRLYLPATKLDAQGMGSAITYARRYALAAIVGVAPDDDDGEAASSGSRTRTAALPPRSEPAAQQQTAPAKHPQFDAFEARCRKMEREEDSKAIEADLKAVKDPRPFTRDEMMRLSDVVIARKKHLRGEVQQQPANGAH